MFSCLLQDFLNEPLSDESETNDGASNGGFLVATEYHLFSGNVDDITKVKRTIWGSTKMEAKDSFTNFPIGIINSLLPKLITRN